MATKKIDKRELIAMAVRIIGRERAHIVRSYTNLIGTHIGKVTNYDALQWIREYDEFLKPARAYLRRNKR